jgi:hypothetical protein
MIQILHLVVVYYCKKLVNKTLLCFVIFILGFLETATESHVMSYMSTEKGLERALEQTSRFYSDLEHIATDLNTLSKKYSQSQTSVSPSISKYYHQHNRFGISTIDALDWDWNDIVHSPPLIQSPKFFHRKERQQYSSSSLSRLNNNNNNNNKTSFSSSYSIQENSLQLSHISFYLINCLFSLWQIVVVVDISSYELYPEVRRMYRKGKKEAIFLIWINNCYE